MKSNVCKPKPQRMCVVCREQSDRHTLQRVVKSPDGHVFLDERGKSAGRGAYICSPECFARALKTKCLDRALRCTLSDQDYQALAEQYSAATSAQN